MYGEWLNDMPIIIKDEENKKLHSLKHKIIDAKDNFAIWLLRL